MKTFDMAGLQAALDSARRARGLTWVDLAAEINRPFEGTPSIPISPATIRSMATKRSVTSAVVLQVLAWFGRTPESFLIGNTDHPKLQENLPGSGPGRILRFDTRAMHAAIDGQRCERKLSWQDVADELPGFTPSMLTDLAGGPLIGFPRVMFITQWLDRPAAAFVRVTSR